MLLEIILIRHGRTDGNDERRYIGITNEPLNRKGKLEAIKSGILPMVPIVYASPMLRAVQTATIKFPNARVITFPPLREMDFGEFENKNSDDMMFDYRYREWVASGCTSRCPGGESRVEFCTRVAVAFSEIVGEALSRRQRYLIIVAHAGTTMAILERFARPPRPYFEWHTEPCGGYRAWLEESTWPMTPILYNVRKL